MDENIKYLSINDTFSFSCSKELSCFNQCCRDLNQYLTPYDILCIKNYLKLPSDIFLEKYTNEHFGPESGLPVITFKTEADNQLKCPFVTPAGCGIYEARPTSCRIYPLARGISRSRISGRITEQYALFTEPHCNGHEQTKIWTVKQWLSDQELEIYNQMNDMLLEIISLKNRFLPGELDIKSKMAFHLACYNLDLFRKQIFEQGLLENFNFDHDILIIIKDDDTELLKFGFKWLQHVLFEKGIKTSNKNNEPEK